MKVEAVLVQRMNLISETGTTNGGMTGKSGFQSEWATWKRLFSRAYRERTLIGVMVMVFQRELVLSVAFRADLSV